jgi:RNA ligase (TIGR02306 family)
MSRKLASIQIIKKLEPIAGADKIEKATILGWELVVLKGEFKEGDECVYIEIDSFLPIRPEYEFLRKSCYKKLPDGEGFRVKTIRLKGQVSQGIAFPLSLMATADWMHFCEEVKEGDDVTEALGIKKYEPPVPACLTGVAKGKFPDFIPKSDETRVQLLQDVLTRHKGKRCYVTEKIDGASCTYFIKDGVFGVCSRNLELVENPDNSMWKLAEELGIDSKLRALGKNIMIQGEIFGCGIQEIQENPYKMTKQSIRFFNAFDIDAYKYYGYGEFIAQMKYLGLETVPVITDNYILDDNIPALVEMSKGNSIINPSNKREGIVIRPIIEELDLQMTRVISTGTSARLSFKVVNPEYLLEEK